MDLFQQYERNNVIKGEKRDPYFQAIRGICVLMVIYIHSKAGNTGAAWELNYWIITRQFCSIAVATFLVLSGYFTLDGRVGGGNRYRKLLMPYLCWSLFYAIINNLKSLQFGRCLQLVVTGRASVQLYYIVVLIELMLITPLLKRAINSRVVTVLLLLVSPVYFAVFNFFQVKYGFETVWKGRDCCAWVSYYYLGMLFKSGKMYLKEKSCILLAVFGLALCFAEGFIFSYIVGYVSMGVGQLKVSTFLFACSVAGLMFSFRGKLIFPRRLVEIGNYSYGIFYLHTFVLKCANALLRRGQVIDKLPLPAVHAIQVSTTAIICTIIVRLARKYIKRKDILSWIGFT